MSRKIAFALGCALALTMQAQDVRKYVVHTSGNVLGCSNEKRAVLQAPASSKPLRIAQKAGYCLLAVDGEPTLYLSLGTENGWSTYFVTDSTDTRAQYTIEEQKNYVLLRNKKTNAYLGTDGNEVGASVFSDKNGTDMKHRWQLADKPQLTVVTDTVAYPISVTSPRQQIEGWGVSLCWWARMCGAWSDSKIDQLVNWLVSPTGLNMNIFRYNIGGGDDPEWTNCTPHHMGGGKGLRAEMEGFQDERGGEFHWDRDEGQRKIMLKIKEKRPDAIFEAFSNSAPWWMTVSGCCAGSEGGGKDNLDPTYYEDFAHYLVEVCKHYKEVYDIEFKTLEPFNESMSSYWSRSGSQEGCHFEAKSQVAFLRVLEPMLKESGLNTIISASDETNVGSSIAAFDTYKSSNILGMVEQWNTHTYGASNTERSRIGSMAREAGMTMWMSETGSGGSGLAGNLNMAQRLIDDVRYIAPSAWVDWQYVEENNDQWCMVKGSFSAANFSRVKNYYVRQQFTRFMKQGWNVVPSMRSNTLAAVNPTGDTLVVALLNTGMKEVHRMSLPLTRVTGDITAYRTSANENLARSRNCYKLLDENVIEATLNEQSVTTLMIPIAPQGVERDAVTDGDTYLIVPQANTEVAVTAKGTALQLADLDASDPSQRWTLKEVSEGVYRLQNGEGKYAQFTSSYALQTSSSATNATRFSIELTDGIHQRIMCWNDGQKRGWDLDNAKLTAGTRVGAYVYGNTAAAYNRNWMLVRVDSQTTGQEDNIVTPSVQKEGREEVFNLTGMRTNQIHKGINILRQKDGSVKKILR